MGLTFVLIIVFAIAAFIASLVIAYIKGIIKKQLIHISILLLIYIIIILIKYILAMRLTPEEVGIEIVFLVGYIDKLYLLFIAPLIAILFPLLKKKVV